MRGLGISLGSLALAWLIWGAILAQTSFKDLRVATFQDGLDLEGLGAASRASARVHRMQRALGYVRKWTAPVRTTAGLWSWVPRWGGDLRQADATLDYVDAMLEGADHLLKSTSALRGGASASTIARLLSGTQELELTKDEVRASLTALAKAERARGRLDAESLSSGVADRVRLLDEARPVLLNAARLSDKLLEARRLLLSTFNNSASDPRGTHQALVEAGAKAADLRASLEEAPTLAGLFGTTDQLDDLERAAGFLVKALGFEGPQTHLLLAQDDEEARPSGGFIAALWEVSFDQGSIASRRFMTSYEVDEGIPIAEWDEAPEGFKLGMGSPVIPFRDQNWWPDFPTSAARLRATYSRAQPNRPRTIIAVNQGALEALLRSTGPLDLGSENAGPVDDSNVREYLKLGQPVPIEERFASWDEQHYASYLLGSRLIAGLEGGEPEHIARLLVGVLAAADAGDLLADTTDPEGEVLLGRLGWNGSLPSFETDSFYWVDSNVFGPKASQDLERAFTYKIDLRPSGDAVAQLTVSYRNPRPLSSGACVQPAFSPSPACYWLLFRLYLPARVSPTSLPSLPLPETALGAPALPPGSETVAVDRNGGAPPGSATKISGLAVIRPGESKQWQFEYALPHAARSEDGLWTYELALPQQPGVRVDEVTVKVRPPFGSCVVATEPTAAIRTPHLEWSLQPARGGAVSVTYRLGGANC